jgi:hypothetical protein
VNDLDRYTYRASHRKSKSFRGPLLITEGITECPRTIDVLPIIGILAQHSGGNAGNAHLNRRNIHVSDAKNVARVKSTM